MKIGLEFNTKEIVNTFVDMVRMWGHRHEAFDMYRKEFAGHLLAKPENNRGVSVYKMVLRCSEVLLFLYRVQS
jgi:hypothetical protein